MKKKIALLISVFTALVLEILPYGAVCNFANPEGAPFRRTFSYFDLTPFGYANFAPFIVAILTSVLLILTVISVLTKKLLRTPTLIVSALDTLISPAPLLYGISFFSVVGALITVSLAICTVIAFLQKQE